MTYVAATGLARARAKANSRVATVSNDERCAAGSARRQANAIVSTIIDTTNAASMPTAPNQPSCCTTGMPDAVRPRKPAAVVSGQKTWANNVGDARNHPLTLHQVHGPVAQRFAKYEHNPQCQ